MPETLSSFLADLFSSKGIYHLMLVFILMYAGLLFNTFIHETGHVVVGRLFGCETKYAWVRMFTGATSFECPEDMPEDQLALAVRVTALAGPIFSLIASLVLWFGFGENSYIRFIALFGFLYSTLPNLSFIPGSDLSIAVENGFPMGIAILLSILVMGGVGFLLLREITEKRFPLLEEKHGYKRTFEET